MRFIGITTVISGSFAGNWESALAGEPASLRRYEQSQVAQFFPGSIFTREKKVKNETVPSGGSSSSRSPSLPKSAYPPSPNPNFYLPPGTIQKTSQSGFNPSTVNILKSLGQKAKSGNASQSEIEQLKQLCDVASEFNRKNSSDKKFDRSKSGKGSFDLDRSTEQDKTWDKDKQKKVKIKGEGSGLLMSGSGSVSTDFSEGNKGSSKDRKANTRKGDYEMTSANTFESSNESELNRAAQTECSSVVEYMGTKDTNASNERIQQLKNQDAAQQRRHELELKKMELDAINANQQNQQQNTWMQMGGALLNNMLSPKQPEQGGANQNELMETIKKQQEQIEQLMKMQQAKPSQ